MQGKATIGGHPIHPMLIPFPIAFFVGALVCDIISIWNGALNWAQISELMIGFGIIGGLAAAIFGFTDYVTAPMSPEAKTTATNHMILNLLTVAIFICAFVVRFNHPTPAGYWLTAIGDAVLLCSGYLGGKLVFNDRVGVASQRVEIPRATRGSITNEEVDVPPFSRTR
jgi:uncharacterized membrane protein